jgi:mRNA interferase MazF
MSGNEKEILRGDIWTADLDPVRGSEQGGVRPVLIIQNDKGNKYSPTVIAAAITGRKKKTLPTHVAIGAECLPVRSAALLEQLRTLDKSRLLRYMGRISAGQMKLVERAIDVSLGKRRKRRPAARAKRLQNTVKAGTRTGSGAQKPCAGPLRKEGLS